ncbi:MAG: isoaspartyl peptidase/L-asparaginase [Pirellulales bacterium]
MKVDIVGWKRSSPACLLVVLLVCGFSPLLQAQQTVLVIHGGAGVLTPDEMKDAGLTRGQHEKVLADALEGGYRELHRSGGNSVTAVEKAIRVLEDSDLFNAGRGAAFTHDGRVELDAAIMLGTAVGDGAGKASPQKRAGAVTGVTHVKNPISAARAVLDMPGNRHVLLAGDGAEQFVLSEANRKKYDIENVSNVYFWTQRRLQQIQKKTAEAGFQASVAQHEELNPVRTVPRESRFGTVGAAAVDSKKSIVAGTSTGGLADKLTGRVGDTPLIGAGTYADDRACGVSCTGTGEVFMRFVTAHDVAARMLYGKSSVDQAARAAIDQMPDEPEGVGGLIALDAEGNHSFAMSKLSVGMYRGYVTAEGEIFVGIYADEKEKPIRKISK